MLYISKHRCTGLRVGRHDADNSNSISLRIEGNGEALDLALFGLPEHITDALLELNELIDAKAKEACGAEAAEASITEAA